MFDNWRWLKIISLVALAAIVVACAPTTVVPPVVETPAPPAGFHSKDPTAHVGATFGEPATLDPAWAYDTASAFPITHVYDRLLEFNRQHADQFVPQLAESWDISDDGMTYTFHIRQGVKFQGGEDLDPGDVEYTFERGLLQGGTFSPQWLLVEPFLGIGLADIAELVDPTGTLDDDRAGLQAAAPADLLAACEKATNAITSDAGAGTVTMTLAQPWGPFLPTLAQMWGSIQDKDWTIAQGAWDGDCATWQNFYSVDDETAPLTKVMNGTGPFILDHWTPGDELVLTRNENYWRAEPIWEGGPEGLAPFQRITVKFIDEWGTRFAGLIAVDFDHVALPDFSILGELEPFVGEVCNYNFDTLDFDCAPHPDHPDGILRHFQGYPLVIRTDGMFTFDINDEGGNNFLGSGQLDGKGVPADFFSDLDVRLAFNYCFDWDAYIQGPLAGYAIQTNGILIPGMPGYSADQPHYTLDIEQCKAHIEAAWGGAVAENGFRLQIGYNIGNEARRTAIEILSNNFQEIDSKYEIDSVGLPWPTFLSEIRASRMPMFFSGWLEDIHDPHNWAQPFTVGTYGHRQVLPEDITAHFQELVNAGVSATDPADRAPIYDEMQRYDYDQAIAIRLAVSTGHYFEQRYMQGWYYNPLYPEFWHYAFGPSL